MDPARQPDDPAPVPAQSPGAVTRALKLVERREHSLLSLFELSHELSVSLDLYRITDLALLNLMGHFGTVRAALWLMPEDAPRQAVLIRTHGVRESVARAIGAGLAPYVTDEFTYEQGTLLLSNWSQDVSAPGAILAIENQLSVLVPIASHGRLLGLIALGVRVSHEPYSPLELEHARAAAGMVGVALENTRLYHGMLESNRRLQCANDDLAELDRLKSEFLQNVNHELRTPLSIIIGYASTLRDGGGLSEIQLKMLAVLQEQAQKLSGMVQNLLDFSGVARESALAELRFGDIRPALMSYYNLRRPGVVERLREFDLSVEDAPLEASFDQRRLHQALDLLMDNAVKFTPLGGHISMRVGRHDAGAGSWVRIQIQDDGPGIPRQQLATLFEPFRQADGSTTRSVGGMGMGLALASRIVGRMGGRLEVESEVGTGTTLSVLLPSLRMV